jgi:Capsule assembly protein Wzi/PAP2 superfamily
MRPVCACTAVFLILGGTLAAQQTVDTVPASQIFSSVEQQDRGDDLQPGEDPENQLISPFVRHMAEDQKNFWTLPLRARKRDLKWIIPAAGGLAGLIAADSWISKQIPDKPSQLNRSLNISEYSLYSMIGGGGGAFILGELSHNDHMRETGLLAAEAAINATAVAYAFKLATERQRPYTGLGEEKGEGEFFSSAPSSTNSSFPSEHSAIAWSIASVVAHEYPGPLTQLAAYGLATTVTLTRVTSQQHFASDVLVGAALGWYFGHQVYRAHHDPELGGVAWGNFFDAPEEPHQRDPKNMSSPYVPPDNWVYPMFDRLLALGFVKTAYLGVRPWTRMECARLVEEAGEQITSQGADNGEAAGIYKALSDEFAAELGRINGAANVGASLDSLYERATQISGTPLTDGFHFAQTLVNDDGRPYSQGFNNILGFTAHANAGPMSFAITGEYQHSPAVPGYSATVQQAIANADATRPFPAGRSEADRLDLLDSTVSIQFDNLQISGGKQSQWWSLAETDPLLLGDNAEPILGIKLDNVSPYHIPLLSSLLGEARSQYFLGRLGGQEFELDPQCACKDQLLGPGGIQPQPFLQGLEIGFKPTQNLEIGFGFTAMFAGPGMPFTFHNFFRTLYSHTANTATNPGKRTTEFDFSYRVPGLRKWLSIYQDSLAVDEYSPILSSRPSLNLGLYMPMLPKLHKMDFRAEIIGTPHTSEFAPGFVYWDDRRFRSGYTNDGNILSSWMGRAGRGGEGLLTYWFSPRSTLQFVYRYQKVDRDFLQGGHVDDFGVRPQIMLHRQLAISGLLQYEHWYFPLLSATGRNDTTAQLQLTFFPHFQLTK